MTQTSTDQTVTSIGLSCEESLSALVDSEASELEVRRLLKVAESEPHIKLRWKHYHMVRQVLRGDLDVDLQIDLSERISLAIAQEPSLNQPSLEQPSLEQEGSQTSSRFKQWRDGMGKVAIAASVAFVFITGVQQFAMQQNEQASEQLAQSPTPDSTSASDSQGAVARGAPEGFALPPFAARTVSAGSGTVAPNSYRPAWQGAQLQNKRALQNYFNYLLLRHAERSSTGGSMGLLPYARVSEMSASRVDAAQK